MNVYTQCLEIQNASNFTGIAKTFGRDVVPALDEEMNWLRSRGVPARFAYHPVVLWWLSKLNDMAGVTDDHPAFGLALDVLNRASDPDCELRSEKHFALLNLYFVTVAEYLSDKAEGKDTVLPCKLEPETPGVEEVIPGAVKVDLDFEDAFKGMEDLL